MIGNLAVPLALAVSIGCFASPAAAQCFQPSAGACSVPCGMGFAFSAGTGSAFDRVRVQTQALPLLGSNGLPPNRPSEAVRSTCLPNEGRPSRCVPCPPDGQPPTPHISEFRQAPISADPAVSGRIASSFWRSAVPKVMPLSKGNDDDKDEKDQGAFAALSRTKFRPIVEIQLSPGVRQDVTLDTDGPSVLLATIRWTGSNDPLQATLLLDGAPVAAPNTTRSLDGRGQVGLRAVTNKAGHATLVVTNTSSESATVRIVLGSLSR